jgi:carbon monoxide dehydrogenase subunit G
MKLDQRVVVASPAEPVWTFLMDVPAMARCVPGVESIVPAGEDTYHGVVKVKVGPIGVRLEGRLTVTARDHDARSASMLIEAADPKVRGAVKGVSTMELRSLGTDATELVIHTDLAILGKLGEFGQPIMRRKADQILAEFGANVAKATQAESTSHEPAGGDGASGSR